MAGWCCALGWASTRPSEQLGRRPPARPPRGGRVRGPADRAGLLRAGAVSRAVRRPRQRGRMLRVLEPLRSSGSCEHHLRGCVHEPVAVCRDCPGAHPGCLLGRDGVRLRGRPPWRRCRGPIGPCGGRLQGHAPLRACAASQQRGLQSRTGRQPWQLPSLRSRSGLGSARAGGVQRVRCGNLPGHLRGQRMRAMSCRALHGCTRQLRLPSLQCGPIWRSPRAE
mmetsp:Transcript_22110/g.75819  ORF Transcript_22110/g.75819 Transcript_22110/m.75819 type:complete len:223 (-) Transcript_22110:2666-3334(-)